MGPILPPEVLDRVIDSLHDDVPMLRVCSLVSRAWMASSRYLLFAVNALIVDRKSLLPFIELLDSPHNTLLARIERLHCTEFQYAQLEALWKALPALLHLRELHIAGNILRIDSLPGPDSQIFPRITNLAMRHVNFPSCRTLKSLLLRFPSLMVLNFQNTLVDRSGQLDTDEVDPSPLRLELDLDSFHLEDSSSTGWLTWRGLGLRARDISLYIPSSASTEHVSEFLAAAGPQLQHLTMRFSSYRLASALRYPATLLSVRFVNAFWIAMLRSTGVVELTAQPELPSVLRHIQSSVPTLQELAFDVHAVPSQLALSNIASEDAALILQGPGFAGLRRLDFRVLGETSSCESLRSTFAALLPGLHARGIIHVHPGKD
ncbi:hypothetical protein FB45DRAFT_1037153 [Roridomyces roridus]|uniref:F-box domain-containing protein n=1 Tax=Roridomyces roridus TaxID=1738132 RepID=A0AAD7B7C9_9AGAR|nr:hypothetical protein FB45DRAFT_1037153 [Roridomyces roridus]